MNSRLLTLKSMLVCCLALATASSAAPMSRTVSYGGRLTLANGKPVTGPVDLSVRFYDAVTAGNALGGNYEIDDVALQQGVFSIDIPLSASDAHDIFDGRTVFVEVKDVTNNKTYPRQRFSIVPYAMKVPVDGTTIDYDNDGALTLVTPPIPQSYIDTNIGGATFDQSNKQTDYVIKWNSGGYWYLDDDQEGTVGGGLVEINGLGASNQSLATAASGAVTAPTWSSVGSTHTLQYPSASAAGVTAGLISKAQFDTFNSKQDAITGAANFTAGTITATSFVGPLTGNATNVTGTVAVANGGTGQTTAPAALNALLPSQGGNTKHVLSTNGTSPAWTAYGTSGANAILQLDGTGNLPALNGSNLTNLDASDLTGTIADGRLSAAVSLLGQTIESGEITNGTIAAADVDPAQVMSATTAPLTLYVNAAGNDAGACTAAGAAACQTFAGVLAKVPKRIEHAVTINVNSATYNESLNVIGFVIKNGVTFTIQGDGGDATISGQQVGVRIGGITGAGTLKLSSINANSNTDYGFRIIGSYTVDLTDATANSNGISGIIVSRSSVQLNGTTLAQSNATEHGIMVYDLAEVSVLSGSVTATNNAMDGIRVVTASFSNGYGAMTLNSNEESGLSVLNKGYFADTVGSFVANNNGLQGVISNHGSHAIIQWATGGSGIIIGTGAAGNGRNASASAVYVGQNSSMLLKGSTTNRAVVKSVSGDGVRVSLGSAQLEYVTSNGNTGIGVQCTAGAQCTIHDLTASSNTTHGLVGASTAVLNVSGPLTLNSNGSTGLFLNGSRASIGVGTETCLFQNNATHGIRLDGASTLAWGCASSTVTGYGTYGIWLDNNSSVYQGGALTITIGAGTYTLAVNAMSTYNQTGACSGCNGTGRASKMSNVLLPSVNAIPSVSAILGSTVGTH